MNWSYSRPLMAGWYWWQWTADDPPRIVELRTRGQQWVWSDRAFDYDDKSAPGGRWSGPIASPNAFDAFDPAPAGDAPEQEE